MGKLASFSKGKGITKNDVLGNGSVKCIRYGELYTHYGAIISKVLSRTNLPIDELVLGQRNDVIIPSSGETALGIAAIACITIENIALGGDINIVRSDQNGIFLAYYLISKKKDIARLAQGISVIHLYNKQLKTLILNIPSKSEQQEIASFLSSVDKKIEQLSQKKDLLERYKKGLMQQLFSREIRFKNEKGKDFPEWEENSLGKLASFSKGKGISKNDVLGNGSVKCIRYGELYTHYGVIISKVLSRTNLPINELVLGQRNDVIIPSSGETALGIATVACITIENIALGGDINIVRSDQNGMFLAYYLISKRKDIARLAQGVSVIHLYNKQLKTLILNIPSNSEQQKIANSLSSVDTKIEQVSLQIELARKFKKGLLQQMFV